MSEIQFYQTRMGKQFYEVTVPELTRQIARLNDNLALLVEALDGLADLDGDPGLNHNDGYQPDEDDEPDQTDTGPWRRMAEQVARVLDQDLCGAAPARERQCGCGGLCDRAEDCPMPKWGG